MTEAEKAYKRNYFATHPEARAKRDAYTKEWMKRNRRKWNLYMSDYHYRKKYGDEIKTEKEN